VFPASRDLRRRRPARGRVRLILLLITALALITIDFRGEGAGGPRDGVLDALGPVRSVVEWVASPFQNAWRGITDYDELQADNARLRAELAEQTGETLEVAELQRRLLALEQLLDVRGTETAVQRVVASVIEAPLSNFERTIEIDRGSNDGVRVGMPVEAGSGLVGRIVQVGRSRSRVELVTDTQFAAGVRLVRSADTGVVEGNGSSGALTISFIGLETVVVPGETVVTSGLEGSQFPSGIVVGTVIAARPDPVNGTQEVDIVPSADLDRLSLVQVVLFVPEPVDNRPVDEPATTEPATTEPATTEPATTEPASPSPETTEPAQVPRPGSADEGAAATSAAVSTIILAMAAPDSSELR
jgi:rod shape-determining protein MreC